MISKNKLNTGAAVLAAFSFISCGTEGKPGKHGEPGEAGVPGQPGMPGTNGQSGSNGQAGKDGSNGTGCTLAKTDTGVLVTCGENTVLILDGQDGQDGQDGEDGQDGKTIVVPACGKGKE